MITNWRRPLTRGALLLMETLWVYAALAFFIALVTSGDRPSLLGVAAVVFGSFCVSRLLQATDLDLGLLRLWGMIASFLLFYAIVRVDFYGDWRFWDFSFADNLFNHTEATLNHHATVVLGIPLLWFVWTRGLLRGQEHMGFDLVLSSFITGVLVCVVVETFAGSIHAAPATLRYVPIVFIAVGLLTIGLTHAARAEDEFGNSFGPTWLISVGGAVFFLAFFALLFLVIDSHTAYQALRDVTAPVFWLFDRLLYYVSWPFLKALELIFKGFRSAYQALTGNTTNAPLQQQQQPDQQTTDQGPQHRGVVTAMHVIVAISLISILIWSTWGLFKRYSHRKPEITVRESTYSEGRLAGDLGDLLGSLLGRLRPNLHLGGLDPARRLYFDLLAAGVQRGVERGQHETPLELAPRLDSAFSSELPEQITLVFDDVRYGALPPPEAELRRLREEFDQARRG